MATLTKGNVIVEDIKIGDIQYEHEYGVGIKSVVIELPTRSEDAAIGLGRIRIFIMRNILLLME